VAGVSRCCRTNARRATSERSARPQSLLALRSVAPWRDLPDDFGPYTNCYNRFVRWRRAGVLERIMNAPAVAHDARRKHEQEIACPQMSRRRRMLPLRELRPCVLFLAVATEIMADYHWISFRTR
jgi:transposase